MPELGIFGNTSMLGANLPVAAGLALTFKMEKKDNVVHRVFRRGREQHRRFSRGAEFRRRQQAAGGVRLREQPLRVFGADREEHGGGRCGRPRRGLRVRRCRHQRQRRSCGVSGDERRAAARARRRGPNAHRVQDLPMAWPLRARQGVLPHQGRAGDVEEPRSAPDLHVLSRPI